LLDLREILLSLFNALSDETEITGTNLLVFVIAAVCFHMGMTPIAEYFTGQKIITSWSSTGSRIPLNRDDTFWLI